MKIKIEDIVFLKTDLELKPRIITKYEVSKKATVFCLAVGTENSWHQDFEFTKDKSEITSKIGFNNG